MLGPFPNQEDQRMLLVKFLSFHQSNMANLPGPEVLGGIALRVIESRKHDKASCSG